MKTLKKILLGLIISVTFVQAFAADNISQSNFFLTYISKIVYNISKVTNNIYHTLYKLINKFKKNKEQLEINNNEYDSYGRPHVYIIDKMIEKK